MSQTRRLAAILAADIAGYSRLMGVDEEGTHERLKALRRELVDPKDVSSRPPAAACLAAGGRGLIARRRSACRSYRERSNRATG
jgi:hypothetical protein